MTTDERMLEAVRQTGGDVQAASIAMNIPDASFRRRLKRAGLWGEVEAIRNGATKPEAEGVHHDPNGGAELTSPPKDCPWTREGLLKHFGFAVDEWKVTNAKLNKWGDTDDPKWQLKLSVVPVKGIIRFPDPNDWTPPPKPRKRRKDQIRSAVIVSDQHCPHQDRTLHALFLERLRDTLPDEGYLMGDLLDFASISRHRDRDGWTQPLNVELQSAFELLRD